MSDKAHIRIEITTNDTATEPHEDAFVALVTYRESDAASPVFLPLLVQEAEALRDMLTTAIDTIDSLPKERAELISDWRG